MEFEKGKAYIFDKETYFSKNPYYKLIHQEKKNLNSWVDDCDGKTVNVKDKYNGTIDLGIFEYQISPKWCKEIKG